MPARIHGHNGTIRTKTYDAWAGMHRRCNAGPAWTYYKYYGGSGIVVCARWKSFVSFLDDMGVCPVGLTLERKDNNKGYSPDNCHWATRKNQLRNTRWNRMVTIGGRTQCLSAWAEETGISRGTIENRIKHGWKEDKLLQPPDLRFSRRKNEQANTNQLDKV